MPVEISTHSSTLTLSLNDNAFPIINIKNKSNYEICYFPTPTAYHNNIKFIHLSIFIS